jgi:hypothetical protein
MFAFLMEDLNRRRGRGGQATIGRSVSPMTNNDKKKLNHIQWVLRA